jgi:hypothetical protein
VAGELKKWLTFRSWQRHGLVLMVGGLVYICLGLSYLTIGELSHRQEVSLSVALNLMPIHYWAVLFIFSGVLACLSSRWPIFHDSWGYMVLAGLSSGWSAVYLTSYIFGEASINNIPFALVWGLMAFMWWGVSGLVNPSKILVVEVPNGFD